MLKKLLKIVHQMQARNPYDDVDGKHSNRFIVVSNVFASSADVFN